MGGDGLVLKGVAANGSGVSVVPVSFIEHDGLILGITKDDPFGGASMLRQTILSGPTFISRG